MKKPGMILQHQIKVLKWISDKILPPPPNRTLHAGFAPPGHCLQFYTVVVPETNAGGGASAAEVQIMSRGMARAKKVGGALLKMFGVLSSAFPI